MNINKVVDFILEKGESKKGNDYYGIYIVSKDGKVKKMVTFISKAEYENILSLLD